jgi:potassium efflux system protein
MSTMSTARFLLIRLIISSLWPAYLLLLSFASRLAPWPKSLGRPVSYLLYLLAVLVFVSNILRSLFGNEGWASEVFQVPKSVVSQLRAARNMLVLAAVVLLVPAVLLSQGLLAPSGQPLYAHTVERLLILSFELTFLWASYYVVRHKGALAGWLTGADNPVAWLGRHRRGISWSLLIGAALLIVLDTQGYGFTARRLALCLAQTIALIVVGWILQRGLNRMIDRDGWRLVKARPAALASADRETNPTEGDLCSRLRQIVRYGIPLVGLVIASWIWEFDLALFRYITEQKLWSTAAETFVTVGDLFKSIVIFAITALVWRNLSTIFAVFVFPRMSEDPGIRFAVLTLCRYMVLGLGVLTGLTAIGLGLEKIGMVLAALGVGLGFGLQEIVSNFISGLILLVERPLRVGDVVTVSNMTGKVDRINIRATTIINGENQSMIIPNREFITGSLINWTHKDKIIRVTIQVGVAYGCDPDQVSDLLLCIAREDPDVLCNPVASAMMEEFGPAALNFSLKVYVPEPSVAGRVKHRLSAQIQKRFQKAGIEIPYPQQELRFHSSTVEAMVSTFASALPRVPEDQPEPHAIPQPHLRLDRAPTSYAEG